MYCNRCLELVFQYVTCHISRITYAFGIRSIAYMHSTLVIPDDLELSLKVISAKSLPGYLSDDNEVLGYACVLHILTLGLVYAVTKTR